MPDDVSERLSEIRERVEAATEGPWITSHYFPHIVDNGRTGDEYVQVAEARDNGEDDAAFIASARSDVPYLLSLVERMAGASEEGWQVTELDEIHPECREVHAEIESWLEQRGLHLDLRDLAVLYQWLDRYARFRVRTALRDAAQEGAE